MRTFIYSLIIFFAFSVSMSAQTNNFEKFTYNIKAEIQGLTTGDVIRFEKVHFPWLNTDTAFRVSVKEEGVFSYEGTAFQKIGRAHV